MSEDEKSLFDGAEINPVLEGLMQLHEIYVNLRTAGFNEREACMIVADGLFGAKYRSP